MDVVIKFVESWSDDDYGVAYDLLTSDSPIREGLSRDEWIERCEEWAEEANPGDLEPSMIYEREPQKPKLWLPNLVTASRSATRKEVEAGWSIELDETPLSDTLPELPTATLVYEDTGRHWFWASYILMQEQGEWRIQNINDEGANAQSLPPAQLKKQIQERDERTVEITKKHKPTDPDALKYLDEISLYMMQAIFYTDALIKVLPYDSSNYETAVARMLEFGQFERCVAYLELLTQRFEEQRGRRLRQLAEVRRQLSKKYFDIEDEERGEQCLERAAENLRESLALENSFEAHISLADVLLEEDGSLDEVEDHLLQAKVMVTNPSDEAHIEMHLGEIATKREQYEEALRHHQRVAELEPSNVDTWVDLAEAYKNLEDFEKADASYRRAIQLQPDDEDLYYTLSKMYSENNQFAKAIEAIEDGLSANPDSAVLNVYLATMYLDNQDYHQAEIFLERAERLDPELEAVKMMRQVLNWSKPKTKTVPSIGKLSRHKLKKKGKR
jgi:tetratricopeptide (TPR) repeat protein